MRCQAVSYTRRAGQSLRSGSGGSAGSTPPSQARSSARKRSSSAVYRRSTARQCTSVLTACQIPRRSGLTRLRDRVVALMVLRDRRDATVTLHERGRDQSEVGDALQPKLRLEGTEGDELAAKVVPQHLTVLNGQQRRWCHESLE